MNDNRSLIASSGIEQLAEEVSGNLAWKLLVGAFPGVGPAIVTAADHISNKRLVSLCKALEIGLERVCANSVSQEFLQSEEFRSLVRKTIRLSEECVGSEKLVLFAGILAGTIERNSLDLDDTSELLDIVNSIRIEDMFVLLALVTIYKRGSASSTSSSNELQIMQSGGSLRDELGGVEPEQLERSLARLSSAGVAKEITGTYFDYTGGVYRPTAYALQFITLLRESAEFFVHIRRKTASAGG